VVWSWSWHATLARAETVWTMVSATSPVAAPGTPGGKCPARGQRGQGNIGVYGQKEQRYHCTVCGRTFSAQAGTPF